MSAALCVLVLSLAAPNPPLVEKYLHAGDLAGGEQALEAALAADPKDDHARFGLGVVRFVQAVERLGQNLYRYGAKAENTSPPFLRLPVPANPDPTPIRYRDFRKVLDDARRDLASAEQTLAGVTDDAVALPLRFADIKLDLDGDGKPTDVFLDLLKKVMRQDFAFLKANPEFRVRFDRGDVAWLRGYCHLLMAMLDGYLAFDTEGWFDHRAKDVFAAPKVRDQAAASGDVLDVAEPGRLGRFRRHLVAVCELNRETWKHVRAETDDDHEWLPHPKQAGVIGLRTTDEMIDAWLAGMTGIEGLLTGKTVLPGMLVPTLKGVSVRAVLDDPPARFDLDAIQRDGVQARYVGKGPAFDLNVLFRFFRVFNDTTAFAYAAWFN